MAYPVYKGKNPIHLVNETKQIVSSQKIPYLKSDTVFGNQMLCIANYYLAKEVVETGTNTGKFIDEWAKEYFNNDKDAPKQAAWCAIFMWKIAEEAAKLQKCTNPFPDYAKKYNGSPVWANARNTLEYLKASGMQFSKSAPKAGCMMFRNSKESNSSGHWGIVTEVTLDKFRTIEGNVKRSDGTEGVGYWEYDKSEALDETNGMQFFYIQNNAGCGDKILPFNGFKCPTEEEKPNVVVNDDLPSCIRKDGNYYFYIRKDGFPIAEAKKFDGDWYVMGLNAGEGWVKVTNCDYDPNVTQPNKPNPITVENYSPSKDTSTPPPQKIEKCKNVIVSVPTKSRLQHYSVLRELHVLADITGAKMEGVPESKRNGSALWYNNRSDLDPKHHTGFGMFRDNIGNSIYVLDLDNPQSVAIAQNGMLGYSIDVNNVDKSTANQNGRKYNVMYLPKGKQSGGGWKERVTAEIHSNTWETYDGKYQRLKLRERGPFQMTQDLSVVMPKVSNLNHVANIYALPYGEQNLFGYLKEIENAGRVLDSPIVILILNRDIPPSISQILQTALSVATTMTTLVGIPIPTPILKTTETLVAITSTGVLNGGTALDFLKSVAQLAEYYAPETVKGIENYTNDIVAGLGSNIKTATEGMKNFYQANNIISTKVLKDAENVLGLYGGEVQKLFDKYVDNTGLSKNIDLTKIVGEKGIKEVSKIVENAQNMLMLDAMRMGLGSNKLIQDVQSVANPLRSVPIVQDLFASAGANSTMATFPKIQQLMASLLANRNINQIANSGNTADIRAALIGQAFGHLPVDKKILAPLQLEALIAKAGDYGLTKENFVLPESVPIEYKECYQFVIKQETGTDVIYCPDGWEWDKQLQKCVNQTATSGWTNESSSNQNLGQNQYGGSQLPTVGTKKETEKKNSNVGSGFDFGRDTGFANSNLDINFDLLKKTGNPEIKVGETLPINYVPPCLVLESDGKYYYYPYGQPQKKSNQEIISVKPNDKIITVLPNTGLVNSGIKIPDDGTTIVPQGGNAIPYNGNVGLPNNNIIPFNPNNLTPLQSLSIPQTATRGEGLAMPLPTLSDMPEKIYVFKSSNGSWWANIGNKSYQFDPINCKIIGYTEDNQDSETKKVTKDELEKEIAIREEERKKAEAEAEKQRILREQQAKENEKRIEAEKNKQIEELRRANQQLIDANKQLETTVKTESKEVPNTEIQKLVDLLNIERGRANEAQKQLNLEKLKGNDNSVYEMQLKELNNSIAKESQINQALKQEIELLKNQKPVVTNNVTPVNNVQPQPNTAGCTDCDKLGMPKVVRTTSETIYGYPNQDCHSCPQCGGCENDCECDY